MSRLKIKPLLLNILSYIFSLNLPAKVFRRCCYIVLATKEAKFPLFRSHYVRCVVISMISTDWSSIEKKHKQPNLYHFHHTHNWNTSYFLSSEIHTGGYCDTLKWKFLKYIFFISYMKTYFRNGKCSLQEKDKMDSNSRATSILLYLFERQDPVSHH